MGLKERVIFSGGHFHILSADDKRKIYYGYIFYKDGKNFKPSMNEVCYWDLMDACEVKIEHTGCFLYLEERKNDSIVDSYKCYLPTLRKGTLRMVLDKRCRFKYGKQTCRITITWENCKAEPIHRDYIWLEDNDNNRYPFAVDCIEPLENNKTELKDQYIFIIPDGKQMKDFSLKYDLDILKRYDIKNV